MRQYAKENDLEIVKEFIEAGVTGAILNRPALNELRDYISQEKPDVVLFFDPDRLSRDFINQVILKNEFDKLGIEVAFYKGGFVGKTPQEKLLFNMRGIISEYELSQLKERTARGKMARLKQGKLCGGAGSALYGYRYQVGSGVGEGIRYIDEKRAEIVRSIYTWFLEGETLNGMVRKLYTLDIPSPMGNRIWGRTSVFRILTNKSYTGKAIFSGIEIGQPQIIDEATFEQAQAKLKRNKELARRNRKRQYLLSGYIKCGYCGRRYIGSLSGYKGSPRYYCSGSYGKKPIPVCQGKTINANYIEGLVWGEVERALLNPDLLMTGLNSLERKDYSSELETVETKLSHMQKEKDRCWNAYLITGDEATFRSEIKVITNSIETLEKRCNEIQALIEASNNMPNVEDVKQACDLVFNNLVSLSFEEKRLCLEALGIRVYLGDTTRIEGALPIAFTPSRQDGETV